MDAIVKHITCKIVLLNGIFNNCGKKFKHSILIKRKGTWRRKKREGIKKEQIELKIDAWFDQEDDVEEMDFRPQKVEEGGNYITNCYGVVC